MGAVRIPDPQILDFQQARRQRDAAASRPPISPIPPGNAPAAPGTPGDPRRDWTLLECYEAFLLPEMRADQAAHGTIQGDFTALKKHWNTRTLNPGVAEISDQTLIDFRDSLLFGDKDRGLPSLSSRAVTVEELNRVYEACSAATWPQIPSITAPLFWRAALVCWYFHGMRTQDLAAYTRRAEGLLWDEVRFDAESPDPDSAATWPHGWLNFVPHKTQRTRGESLVLPLHEVSRRHLELLKVGHGKRVFPSPYGNKQYYRQWWAIQEHAGIVRPFEPSDLRKTCNTAWNRARFGIGVWILGQKPRGVNAEFYTVIEPLILETIERVEVPEAFRQRNAGGRQRLLF